MSLRTTCLLLAGFYGAFLFAAQPTVAQEKSDILKNAKARQDVELQRVKADFKDTNDEASKVARDNPAKAIVVLRSLSDRIKNNTDIPATERDTMVKSIAIRISAFTERVADASTPIVNPVASARQQEEKNKAQEAERLKSQFAEVERLRRAGKTEEAASLARQIGGDNPGNSAAQATRKQTTVAQARAADEYIKEQKRQGFLAVVMDQERAAIPQTTDITFPKDWLEKTAKRSQVKMTEAEKKILKALDTPMDIDIKDSTLEAVIDYINDKSGVTILVPQTILDEKAITYKTPAAVTLKKVTMRTVLKKVLGDVGLTYIIKDNVIQATTEERAKQTLTTRTYYIGDLIGMTAFRQGSIRSQAQMMRAVNDIIGMVVSTQPETWWLGGGPGTIAFDPGTMSLVVRQTSEIHYQLGLSAGGR